MERQHVSNWQYQVSAGGGRLSPHDVCFKGLKKNLNVKKPQKKNWSSMPNQNKAWGGKKCNEMKGNLHSAGRPLLFSLLAEENLPFSKLNNEPGLRPSL